MEPRKERFSIRKFSIGAASVLIGFSFMSMAGSQKAHAATGDQAAVVQNAKNNEESANVQKNTENAQNNMEGGVSETTTATQTNADSKLTQSPIQNASTDTATQNASTEISAKEVKEENKAVESTNSKQTKSTETEVSANNDATNLKNKQSSVAKLDVNENKVVAPKASVQEEKAVVRDSALRGAFVELRSNTPEALSTNGTQSEDASNWQSLANALNNGNVGTINITQDIIINGRVNGVTGNNNYLYLDSQGSAREVTINGNGHKIEFGQYSIAVQNKNYQNTDSAWKITVKNTRIIASESKYSPISFYGSAENTKKSQLVFDGVDANLDNRTLVDEYGKNLPVVFKGENRIWVTSMPMGYNTVTSLTTVVDSGITAFKVHGDIANKSGSAINANNWILWSKDTGENSTVINEGATLSLQVLSDDIRGVQTGNQLVAGQPNYGSMVVNGTLDAKMAKGHSSAISTQNLTIGSQGIVTIHTQQDNQADGKEDSTTNAVTNYNGFHYAPVNIFGGFITSVAFPASTQKGYLTNNGNLTIIRDNSDKTLTPLISFGAGGINKNMDMKLYVGPGASLDLQDNSDTYVQGNNTNSPFSGMISMWGTSSTNSLEFNNPAYVNLQRTGDLRGSLIRLEGVQNNAWVNGPDANSAVTPIAQWDQGNMSDSPSNTWYVDQLHIQNEWGNNFDQYIPKGKVPQVGISHKGVDTLYDSNASVKMAENQAGGRVYRIQRRYF